MSDAVIEHDGIDNVIDLPENDNVSKTSKSSKLWWIWGGQVPREEIMFFSQIIISYITIVACIINLSLQNGDSNFWSGLLGTCLALLMPNPKLHHKTNST